MARCQVTQKLPPEILRHLLVLGTLSPFGTFRQRLSAAIESSTISQNQEITRPEEITVGVIACHAKAKQLDSPETLQTHHFDINVPCLHLPVGRYTGATRLHPQRGRAQDMEGTHLRLGRGAGWSCRTSCTAWRRGGCAKSQKPSGEGCKGVRHFAIPARPTCHRHPIS